MIGRLLHIANSYPGVIDQSRFYAMKERILKQRGTPDGHDIQHIKGKGCWSCGGTGVYYHMSGSEDTCWKCCGTGWFKRPVWIVLHRYQLGRFTFHIPGERSYEKPVPNTTRINGYVRHPDYGYRKPRWACIALGLLFDRSLAWVGICDAWCHQRWVQSIQRRCLECHQHTWSWRKWRCNRCDWLLKTGKLRQDVPF